MAERYGRPLRRRNERAGAAPATSALASHNSVKMSWQARLCPSSWYLRPSCRVFETDLPPPCAQSYVDDHLMCALSHGGQLTSAAIVGMDGGVWAQSAAFPAITKAEVDTLLAGFSDPGVIAASGIMVGGQKARLDDATGSTCRESSVPSSVPRRASVGSGISSDAFGAPYAAQFLSIGGDSGVVLRGKKGTDGITIKKTESALVVGIYGKDAAPGEANTVVENLGDYLKNQGI